MIASSDRPGEPPVVLLLGQWPTVTGEEPLVDREQQRLVVRERPVEVEQEGARCSIRAGSLLCSRDAASRVHPRARGRFLHAFWNILLARARDPESATAVALVAAVIVFAPVTALRFDAEWAVWPFIVVTSMLQLLYFALLATAYRKAELSFVYPVARGDAPAIVLVVSVVVLGHGTSPAQVVGVALVGVGVLLVRGLRRPADPHALAFALGIACVIASYTLLDKRGITHASPVTYLELSMIPAALGYAARGSSSRVGRACVPSSAPRRCSQASPRSPPTHSSWRPSSARRPLPSPRCARRASSSRRSLRRSCCTSR